MDQQNTLGAVVETLPILDLDHPGAHDLEYRARREAIARAAFEFHRADPTTRQIPLVDYTDEEHNVWRYICDRLAPLHEQWACASYKEGRELLGIPTNTIPSVRVVSERLASLYRFRLEPVPGLVLPRQFLMKFADNVLLCTQYIRHHSKPEFTPEPDIVHEILGHAPMFTSHELRVYSRMMGEAARAATPEQMEWLSRLYWYTVEYGLIEERGEPKAYGAGLLGGIQDLTNAFDGTATLKPFRVGEVIETPYNYSFTQPTFFVVTSFADLERQTERLLASFQSP